MAPEQQQKKLLKWTLLGNVLSGLILATVLGTGAMIKSYINDWYQFRADTQKEIPQMKKDISDHYNELIILRGAVVYKTP